MLGPHADLLQPLERPGPLPSPFDWCPGTGCAGEGAMQHTGPCPPHTSLPATHGCCSGRLPESTSTAHCTAVCCSVTFPSTQKRHHWDRERSKVCVLGEVIHHRTSRVLKKLPRNLCSPTKSGVRNQLCNHFPQMSFSSAHSSL